MTVDVTDIRIGRRAPAARWKKVQVASTKRDRWTDGRSNRLEGCDRWTYGQRSSKLNMFNFDDRLLNGRYNDQNYALTLQPYNWTNCAQYDRSNQRSQCMDRLLTVAPTDSQTVTMCGRHLSVFQNCDSSSIRARFELYTRNAFEHNWTDTRTARQSGRRVVFRGVATGSRPIIYGAQRASVVHSMTS